MSNLGYIRVSTVDQNTQRQKESISRVVAIDRWYEEKASGKNTDRPQLKAIMDYARDGDIDVHGGTIYTDTIYVDSFSRLARSTKDLLSIIEELEIRKVKLISVKENLDTSTPQGKLMITVIGAINQFEREQLLERQAEGIAIAKAEGRYKGRKKIEITDELIELHQLWTHRKITKKKIQEKTGLSRTTLHRRFKEIEENNLKDLGAIEC